MQSTFTSQPASSITATAAADTTMVASNQTGARCRWRCAAAWFPVSAMGAMLPYHRWLCLAAISSARSRTAVRSSGGSSTSKPKPIPVANRINGSSPPAATRSRALPPVAGSTTCPYGPAVETGRGADRVAEVAQPGDVATDRAGGDAEPVGQLGAGPGRARLQQREQAQEPRGRVHGMHCRCIRGGDSE